MKANKIGYNYPENIFRSAFEYFNDVEFDKYLSGETKETKMFEILSSSKITARELDMIEKHFEQGMTMTAIAKEYSLTLERIRQLIHKTLSKIYKLVRLKDTISSLQCNHDSITIEELFIIGLINNRIYNSITKYGKINKGLAAKELLNMINTGEIYKFRNLGEKSINELKATLLEL